MKNLLTALLAAQKQIDNPRKGSVNPHFKSAYADLEAVIDSIRGPLHENGLTIIQHLETTADNADVIYTTIYHESGENLRLGPTRVPTKDPADPQKLKGGVTYMRRTTLLAALFLAEADDDGNAAATPPPIRNGIKKPDKTPPAKNKTKTTQQGGPTDEEMETDYKYYSTLFRKAPSLRSLVIAGERLSGVALSKHQKAELKTLYLKRKAELELGKAEPEEPEEETEAANEEDVPQ